MSANWARPSGNAPSVRQRANSAGAIGRMPLLPGVYAVRIGVALGDAFQSLFYVENAAQVRVVDERLNRAIHAADGEGFIHLEGSWQLFEAEDSLTLVSGSIEEPTA